uniref:hypothetical protein n=1 Tax=Drosera capensis TaxID=4366 RepID=UPI002411757D|nr:hypothetical protein P8577_pgp036 [Drosera capensis]YP_010737246.1 hypothetical protein P8577_pgp018 [Drosera capensis]WEQ03487.1 hypothetical protein [Drosera capensis]WEQ03505.1 hypothetical protein [Drosera capensis]
MKFFDIFILSEKTESFSPKNGSSLLLYSHMRFVCQKKKIEMTKVNEPRSCCNLNLVKVYRIHNLIQNFLTIFLIFRITLHIYLYETLVLDVDSYFVLTLFFLSEFRI